MADPAMIAVRLAVYAALAAIFGLGLFGLQTLRGEALPFGRAIVGAAVIGLFASASWLVLLVAAMGGVTPGAVDRATLATILSSTAIGWAWQVRMAALVVLLTLALLARRARSAPAAITLAGGVALGSLAWTGHGAMDDGAHGWLHLIADIAHLLAAGAWIGALFAFLALAFGRATDPPRLHRVLHGFARTGTVVVAVLIVTGAINLWVLVGPDRLPALADDAYGRLLLVKLVLFGGMLGLAAANRYRLAPALRAAPHDAAPLAALRRSLLAETAAALVILALVAWLGLLAPAGTA